MAEIIINDSNYNDFVSPVVDGEIKVRGLIPRDYSQCPVGYMACAKPFDLPLIPESEWEERLAAQRAAKAQLSDVRNRGMNGQPMPSRDQNGKGYCWAHSGTSAHLIVRAMQGQPYADLSAFAVACIIKGFRDQGGWGSQGVEFMARARHSHLGVLAAEEHEAGQRQPANMGERQAPSHHGVDGHGTRQQSTACDVLAVGHSGGE